MPIRLHTASQFTIATFGAACFAASLGSAAEPLPDELLACAHEAHDERRLACYDREIARHRAPPSAPIEGRAPGADRAREKPWAEDAKPQPVTAKVKAIGRRPFGELVVTLDNGQIWAETRPSGIDVKIGDEVVVSSGWFGSYRLAVQRGRSTSVRPSK